MRTARHHPCSWHHHRALAAMSARLHSHPLLSTTAGGEQEDEPAGAAAAAAEADRVKGLGFHASMTTGG